jgi:serine/threonine protein kinase
VHRCPKCSRDFEEAGFCPFDGTSLEAAAAARTVQTGEPIRAVSAADGTGSAVDLLRQARQEKKDSPFASLIGKTLDGRYRIKSVLGEGGMGVVFLAEHVVIEKLVAVKILKKDAARNESVTKRFVREARAASRIGHPNIIDVTDFGTTKTGITYSVMEYVEGATLSRVVKYESPLPTPRVLHIVTQMARALAAAHAKGVVHRDLKPDNVFLVDRDGRADFVKIVDFGIARMLPIPGNSEVSRLTRVGSVFGTPEYMAPEQASGRSDTDHRVDIYALGTIMYELFTGRVPHKGDSTVRTLAMQMLDEIPPMQTARADLDLDREIEAIVMKALAKERDDRFADMDEMARAIGKHHTPEVVAPGASLGSVPIGPTATTLSDAPETEVDVHPAGADAGATEEYVGPPARMRAGTGSENQPTARYAPPEADTTPTTDLGDRSGGHTRAPTEIYEPTAPVGEPAFVVRKRRPELTDLDADGPDDSGPGLAVWIGALALAAGAVVVIALLVLRDSGSETSAEIADAAVRVAVADAGAAVIDPVAGDAAVAEVPADAAAGKRPNHRLDPVRRVDAGSGDVTGTGDHVTVKVITVPTGGALYIGKDYYAGSDGTSLRRPGGSTLTVRCTVRGHRPGRVKVLFDGDTGVAICRMKRERVGPGPGPGTGSGTATKCVDGIKNPFGDCP